MLMTDLGCEIFLCPKCGKEMKRYNIGFTFESMFSPGILYCDSKGCEREGLLAVKGIKNIKEEEKSNGED